MLLLQVVNKNIFNADLTKLLGAEAFSQAPRLAVQMIDLAEKGRVTAHKPPLPPFPSLACADMNMHVVLQCTFSHLNLLLRLISAHAEHTSFCLIA